MGFRRLLYMSEHPPSTVGGQPLIIRQLLLGHGMDHLHVMCDARLYRASTLVAGSFLPCPHTPIRNAGGGLELRPRRVFTVLADTANLLRIGTIVRTAERLVTEHGVEAIFTVPWRCDFALAAYRLSLSTGLPLYVFETDDWTAMNPSSIPGLLVRRHHGELLRHAEKVWVTSPAMVERHQKRFGVDAEFLFHYIDAEAYVQAGAERARLSDPGTLRIVYTGAINAMFFDTMERICEQINTGIEVAGRRVRLDVYGSGMPTSFQGRYVHYRGLVSSEAIPAVLANADVTLIAVTFATDSNLVDLIRTSLFTKTVDYLAASRPVIVVSPPDSAEVRYFGDVATVVDSPDPARFVQALARIARDDEAVAEQCARGLEFVRDRHSLQRRDEVFLRHFAA